MEPATDLFLQQVFTSITQVLPSNASIYSSLLTTYVHPHNVDTLVELEMQRIKHNFSHKEQQYVEQMLVENPIIVDRRPSTSQHQLEKQELRQQRADACRRSRFNNKIKKAKSKYQHKFISQKLIHSSEMFGCIQDLIANAEFHALNQGVSSHRLQQMRKTYGVDRSLDHSQELEYKVLGELCID